MQIQPFFRFFPLRLRNRFQYFAQHSHYLTITNHFHFRFFFANWHGWVFLFRVFLFSARAHCINIIASATTLSHKSRGWINNNMLKHCGLVLHKFYTRILTFYLILVMCPGHNHESRTYAVYSSALDFLCTLFFAFETQNKRHRKCWWTNNGEKNNNAHHNCITHLFYAWNFTCALLDLSRKRTPNTGVVESNRILFGIGWVSHIEFCASERASAHMIESIETFGST